MKRGTKLNVLMSGKEVGTPVCLASLTYPSRAVYIPISGCAECSYNDRTPEGNYCSKYKEDNYKSTKGFTTSIPDWCPLLKTFPFPD